MSRSIKLQNEKESVDSILQRSNIEEMTEEWWRVDREFRLSDYMCINWYLFTDKIGHYSKKQDTGFTKKMG